MTKAEVFQELIRKVLHRECELEEAEGIGVGTETESRDCERTTDGNEDRGHHGSR